MYISCPKPAVERCYLSLGNHILRLQSGYQWFTLLLGHVFKSFKWKEPGKILFSKIPSHHRYILIHSIQTQHHRVYFMLVSSLPQSSPESQLSMTPGMLEGEYFIMNYLLCPIVNTQKFQINNNNIFSNDIITGNFVIFLFLVYISVGICSQFALI